MCWVLNNYIIPMQSLEASLVAQSVKNMPAMQDTWVHFLGGEDPLEKEMATHSSIPAWKIPWTEEPGRLQFVGSQESDMTQQLNHHHHHHQSLECENYIMVRQDDAIVLGRQMLTWSSSLNNYPQSHVLNFMPSIMLFCLHRTSFLLSSPSYLLLLPDRQLNTLS